MRKIVDFKIHDTGNAKEAYTVVALCDDGTMWQQDGDDVGDPWFRFSDIPQDNPTPVLELTPEELAEIQNVRQSWACNEASDYELIPNARSISDKNRSADLASALDKVLALAGKKDGQ